MHIVNFKLKINSQGWSLIFSIGAIICLLLIIVMVSEFSQQSIARYSKSSLKARSVSLFYNVTNKKDRLGNLSITWILRVGATGFEPAI